MELWAPMLKVVYTGPIRLPNEGTLGFTLDMRGTLRALGGCSQRVQRVQIPHYYPDPWADPKSRSSLGFCSRPELGDPLLGSSWEFG